MGGWLAARAAADRAAERASEPASQPSTRVCSMSAQEPNRQEELNALEAGGYTVALQDEMPLSYSQQFQKVLISTICANGSYRALQLHLGALLPAASQQSSTEIFATDVSVKQLLAWACGCCSTPRCTCYVVHQCVDPCQRQCVRKCTTEKFFDLTGSITGVQDDTLSFHWFQRARQRQVLLSQC